MRTDIDHLFEAYEESLTLAQHEPEASTLCEKSSAQDTASVAASESETCFSKQAERSDVSEVGAASLAPTPHTLLIETTPMKKPRDSKGSPKDPRTRPATIAPAGGA
jgi:hypothetical protein